MKLFEHEGKDIFEAGNIPVLNRRVVSVSDSVSSIVSTQKAFPVVVKAQTLSGKRGKRGLVKVISTKEALSDYLDELHKRASQESFSEILIEEAADIAQELYVSITYSTKNRGPVLLFTDAGGMEVEELESVTEIDLEVGTDLPPLPPIAFNDTSLDEVHQQKLHAKVWQVVQQLWVLFQERDLFLAEINPLVITKSGKVVALDAKVVTDDAAAFRQAWDFPERNMFGSDKSWAEIEAEKIDAQDHRGAVGRVYLDLPGDIGVIAAGGGASLVAMDAMVTFGLKPANYTEFSGNPPGYKVKRLTEIVLAKKNLQGAILVGGKANFTDQVETLSGFLEALEEINPPYPIVVRRDGPRMDEAKALLEAKANEKGWNIVVFDSQTSIIEAIETLVTLVASHKK